MITHPDHRKPERLYLKAKMSTMQVQRLEEEHPKSNSESKSEFNELSIDIYHYKRVINGETDQEFTAPIVVNSIEDLKISIQQIQQQIVDGEITITIHKTVEFYDDIPSPTTEDVEKVIEIMDNYQLPSPDVPKPQQISDDSWD